MSELTCPKCQGSMRSYERSGITVDQCSDCRGIFLDRGELEKLVDAESSHYAAPAAPPKRDEHRDYDDRSYKKKKKRSFLEEMFD